MTEEPAWEFAPALYVLPSNANTFGESLSAPRRKYVLADEPDPRDEVIRRLMALLTEAQSDLTAYIDAEYPHSMRVTYPDVAKRHHRDMGLCRQIDAALTFAKEQLK